MQDTSYLGYSNHSTGTVALMIDNDKRMHGLSRIQAKRVKREAVATDILTAEESAKYQLAGILSRMIEHEVHVICDGVSFGHFLVNDLVNGYLCECNFAEIAEALLSEE